VTDTEGSVLNVLEGAEWMGAKENLAVHEQWTDAEDRHDLSHHADFLHNDLVLNVAGQDPVIGLAAYLALVAQTYAALDDYRVTVDDRFATDDRVVARWQNSGVHTGDLNGMPATGKKLEWAGVSIWEFDDGKARRGWVFQDVAALMTQLMG
jgi:steroid delta-isomerase-like uncharacterized protein